MNYRALRGVCIGVDRHLSTGDVADLDPATGKFLISIKAVEEVSRPPALPAGEPAPETAPADTQGGNESKSTPAKSGRKEK